MDNCARYTYTRGHIFRAGEGLTINASAAKGRKIKDNEFRFVERILYDYAAQDTSIAELEADLAELMESLLPQPKGANMSQTPGIMATDEKSSEPEKWTIKRDENLYAQYLRQRIAERRRHKAIAEQALATLTQQERDFCRLFYEQCKSIRACSTALHYGQRRLYTIRQNVVYKVARFTGLI